MSPKDKIKEKLPIYDVISHYIRLEKSGNQWKAKCPFHNEKTASFYVSPIRESFHCFGCDKHGDIFTFVMEIEKIDFLETLKILAMRSGVILSDLKREDNNNIYEILTSTQEYFYNNLLSNNGLLARKYLIERGVNNDMIGDYKIGYATMEWTALYDYLIKKGFVKEHIIDSGVCFVSEKSSKVFDKWRGRIMFPIHGQSDQVLGFTGRILPEYDDGKQGKYVNSPETKVFKKNQILFNYNKAKQYIADTREVILVEGQMDAIMSYQAGIRNVVAVSGTAFTDTHISILKRLADNIVLCFDNDEAGKSARNRTALLCALAQFEIYNINISQITNVLDTKNIINSDLINNVNLYKDVADIVKDNYKIWQKESQNKKLFIETLCEEGADMDEKQKILFIKNNILPFVKAYNSSLLQNYYLKIVAKELSYNIEDLASELKSVSIDNQYKSPDYKFDKNNNVSNDTLIIKSFTEMDYLLTLSSIYDILKIESNTIDADILDFLKSKNIQNDLFNLDYLQEEFSKIPREEIDKKFIDLESKNAISKKYFMDTFVKYLKYYIEDKIRNTDNVNKLKDLLSLKMIL